LAVTLIYNKRRRTTKESASHAMARQRRDPAEGREPGFAAALPLSALHSSTW
jgi:hypothetical protein